MGARFARRSFLVLCCARFCLLLTWADGLPGRWGSGFLVGGVGTGHVRSPPGRRPHGPVRVRQDGQRPQAAAGQHSPRDGRIEQGLTRCSASCFDTAPPRSCSKAPGLHHARHERASRKSGCAALPARSRFHTGAEGSRSGDIADDPAALTQPCAVLARRNAAHHPQVNRAQSRPA